MELTRRSLSCAIGAAVVIPALVASVSLPLAGESHQAYAAAPAKVSSVKTSSVTKSGFKVTWKKASSKKVKGYQLKIYKGKTLKKTYVVKGRSVTSKSASGLSSNTKYTVKVRAYSGSSKKKYGKWSSSKTVTTKKASNVSSTSFYDSWQESYYAIEKVETGYSDDYSVPENHPVIVVHYKVTNKGSEPVNSWISLQAFQNGKSLESAYSVKGLKDTNVDLWPGHSTHDWVAFELKNDSPVTLYTSDWATGKVFKRIVNV